MNQKHSNKITDEQIIESKFNENFRTLIEFQINRINELIDEGKQIVKYLPGRLKIQIRWIINCARKILEIIRKRNYNTLHYKIRLKKIDYFLQMFKAIIFDKKAQKTKK